MAASIENVYYHVEVTSRLNVVFDEHRKATLQ